MTRDLGNRKDPLAVVPEADLLRWCSYQPAVRYLRLARVVPVYEIAGEAAPPRWTKIALRFLEQAPDPAAILHEFVARFTEGGWSGSLASALNSILVLFDQLNALTALESAVREERERVKQWIEEAQHRESAFDRLHDERFE